MWRNAVAVVATVAAMFAVGGRAVDPAGAMPTETFLPVQVDDPAAAQVTVDYEERFGPRQATVWVYEDPDDGLCEPVPAGAWSHTFTLAGGTGRAVDGFVASEVLRDGMCVAYQAGPDAGARVFYRADFARGCIVVESEGDVHGAFGECADRPSVVFEDGVGEQPPPTTTTSTSTSTTTSVPPTVTTASPTTTTSAPPVTVPSPPTTTGGALPATGADPMPLVGVGLAFLGLGGAALVGSRRFRQVD